MKSPVFDNLSVKSPERSSERFSASDCILAALEQVVQTRKSARITVPSVGMVSVDPVRGLCWPAFTAEDAFLLTPSAEARIEWVPVAEDKAVSNPLEDLLWKAAWQASGGILLDRCHPYDVVELRHWPNFTRLPHIDSLFPLCSLLSHRPSSLSFAHRMLRLPQADAFRFYSAATAAGLVRVISAQPARTGSEALSLEQTGGSVEQGATAFWGRLFKRISGL